MCGIAGVITLKPDTEEILQRAQNVQQHRGPDAQAVTQYKVSGWTVGFAHQRLSILDLSEAGNQPMVCRDFKGSLIYNGEIYNYLEIREMLLKEGFSFTSDTDTEVMLVALHHWGENSALNKFNGMWAFAWLDIEKQRLVLSRDRTGVKPIYYYLSSEGELYFASEIKAILAMARNKFCLNEQKIGEFILQSQFDTSAETMFRGIQKIPAAHFAVIDLNARSLSLHLEPFWNIPFQEGPIVKSMDSLTEQVRELFIDAVRLRLRSDVPIGVLLSGGVDSSAIACVMHYLSDKRSGLNLLAMVSRDPRFDESPFIDIVARHLDSRVRKVVFDFGAGQLFDYFETVSWFNDEPIAHFSEVAQHLLMQQARDAGITVLLGGQGSDEILCGYLKYFWFYMQSLVRKHRYLQAIMLLNTFWRNGTIIREFSMHEAKRYFPDSLKSKALDIRGDRLGNYAPVSIGLTRGTTVQERQALDIQRFSIPALTHFEDRMSMSCSREVRAPFLDYRLIELLVPLPISYKLCNGWTKYIFRKSLEPFMPKEIAWRKDKKGFSIPAHEWLKNELKGTVSRYFAEDALMFKFGLVNRVNLMEKYELFCGQTINRGRVGFKEIFMPLALEVWLRKYEKYITE